MESSRLRVTIRSEWKGAIQQPEGESQFGRTHPRIFRPGIDGLRGASDRDDGQMPPAPDEPHFNLERPCPATRRVHLSLQ